MDAGIAWIGVAAIVLLFRWAIRRARRGYQRYVSLEARLEAHAAADARAAALASNSTIVRIGAGTDHDDDDRAITAAYRAGAADALAGRVGQLEGGTELCAPAAGLLEFDGVRDQARPLNAWQRSVEGLHR